MRKVYTSSKDKKEFAKFKEEMIAKLDTGESQISEQVMSKDDLSLDDVQIRSWNSITFCRKGIVVSFLAEPLNTKNHIQTDLHCLNSSMCVYC